MTPYQHVMRAPSWIAPLGFLLTTPPFWMPGPPGMRAFLAGLGLVGVILICVAFATFVMTYDPDGYAGDPPPPLLRRRARLAVAATAAAGIAVAAIGAILVTDDPTAVTLTGVAVALAGFSALMMDAER